VEWSVGRKREGYETEFTLNNRSTILVMHLFKEDVRAMGSRWARAKRRAHCLFGLITCLSRVSC
jgi:hypothetical protein